MVSAVFLALALAGNHGGGGGGGSHAAPPAAHAAPAPRPAGGFSLPRDIAPSRPAAPSRPVEPSRPSEPARPAPAPVAPRPVTRPVQPLPRYQARPPAHGAHVTNPHHWGSWQWNNGVSWSPAGAYWGGGFWGPWALGLAVGAYFVQPDSPGAELLSEYGLTQTPCGPPNLVEIFGPDGSEICAYPNDLVAPGQYEVDPETLTLISY